MTPLRIACTDATCFVHEGETCVEGEPNPARDCPKADAVALRRALDAAVKRATTAEESVALWQRSAELHRADVVETRKSRDHWRDCEGRQRAATDAALRQREELTRALREAQGRLDDARADYDSLAYDAARVILASERGGLDDRTSEAIDEMRDNGCTSDWWVAASKLDATTEPPSTTLRRELDRWRNALRDAARHTHVTTPASADDPEGLAQNIADVLTTLQDPDDARDTAIAERDAERAEVARLRRMIEHAAPWQMSDEPTDEEMQALRLRWAFGPEKYQADADALISAVMRDRKEKDRLTRALREAQAIIAGRTRGSGQ